MARYGNITDHAISAEQFRVDVFLQSLGYQFGNGGFSEETIKFLHDNKDLIEDAFISDDSAWILPRTHEFAAKLFAQCVHYDKHEDNEWAEADEVGWDKLGNRYYLGLWWD